MKKSTSEKLADELRRHRLKRNDYLFHRWGCKCNDCTMARMRRLRQKGIDALKRPRPNPLNR